MPKVSRTVPVWATQKGPEVGRITKQALMSIIRDLPDDADIFVNELNVAAVSVPDFPQLDVPNNSMYASFMASRPRTVSINLTASCTQRTDKVDNLIKKVLK